MKPYTLALALLLAGGVGCREPEAVPWDAAPIPPPPTVIHLQEPLTGDPKVPIRIWTGSKWEEPSLVIESMMPDWTTLEVSVSTHDTPIVNWVRHDGKWKFPDLEAKPKYTFGDRVTFELQGKNPDDKRIVCGTIKDLFFDNYSLISYQILFGPGTEGSDSVQYDIREYRLSPAKPDQPLSTAAEAMPETWDASDANQGEEEP